MHDDATEHPAGGEWLTADGLHGGEAQLRHLLDKLPAGAYMCDPAGLITYFNHHAVQLWGRAPKLNDPIDRFCGSFKLYAADGAPIAHHQCWMALALQNSAEYNGEEIIVERPDGGRLTVLAHANPIRDDSGKLVGAVNVLVDISDRKRAEEAQARLAAIVESSEDAIVSKTLEGRIISWNGGAQRLFGYTAQEAIGSPISLIIPPDKHDEELSILARLRRGERIEHYETVRVTKQGRRLDISLTISPVRDGSGRIVGASKVARDITSKRQAEQSLMALAEQLRDADRRKDEFLATLAHELRNPLAPISNSLHLLRLSDDLSPTVERVRGIMETQVNHLVRLVDDLMEVSRITRGKIEMRKEAVELASVVTSAVAVSRPLIEAAGHQLAVTLPSEPLTLEADPVRLAQVISNLLNNAAKYTEPGGQIWLTARQVDGEAVLSVRDIGLGIPAEMLPRVFDMFAQVDRTLKRSQGGLGIGLTLAKKLVELHGGRIEARSDGAGQGSEFVVYLPVADNAQSAPAPLWPSRISRPALPARRILVVDDAAAAEYILGKLLEKMGQSVCTTRDAISALEIALTERPDVVISDIAMPRMDGYELARRLRQAPALQGVVLVALTGYGQDSDRDRALEAGFDFHLVKPVGLEALHALLASLPTLPSHTSAGTVGESI